MSFTFAQRELSLAGAALLGIVVALAIAHHVGSAAQPAAGVRPVIATASSWPSAVAEPRRALPLRSTCGWLLQPQTLGVTHPVLPCGAKLFILYRGRRVLTQVVDRSPTNAGSEFQLTPALAEKLHFEGQQPIRWTFARGGTPGSPT